MSPIVPARPARVQGPGGRVQAPQSYVTPGLAVGLGSTQPRGIIAALDAGMDWARDKSLFDFAMNRIETLVNKVHQSAAEPRLPVQPVRWTTMNVTAAQARCPGPDSPSCGKP